MTTLIERLRLFLTAPQNIQEIVKKTHSFVLDIVPRDWTSAFVMDKVIDAVKEQAAEAGHEDIPNTFATRACIGDMVALQASHFMNVFFGIPTVVVSIFRAVVETNDLTNHMGTRMFWRPTRSIQAHRR